MTYLFLVAGKGTRLHPLTLTYPKCLYMLDESTTVLHRMVKLIRKYDPSSRIVLITGFMDQTIAKTITEVTCVHNPFYRITNSIVSLWFAKDYMDDDNITIINGDTVLSEQAVKDILCTKTERPTILLDSSIKEDGDYNVQVEKDQVVVMSKNLNHYYGEYAGVTKCDARTASALKATMEEMMREEQFDAWYEDIVVRMIFRNNYSFYFQDLCNYEWTEVDSVDDLIKAKKIHHTKQNEGTQQ